MASQPMGPPVDCDPSAADDFTVTYYLDDGGLPGAVHAGPMPVSNLAKVTGTATVTALVGDAGAGDYQIQFTCIDGNGCINIIRVPLEIVPDGG